MKKRNLFILGIFLFLLAFACRKELEHAPPLDESGDFVNFDAVSAQAYFETNATDLSPLRFSDNVSTRAKGVELVPEWDKAMVSANGEAQIVEVPIWSNSVYISIESVMENGKLAYQKFHFSKRRLIVARRWSGEISMYVITLMPFAAAEGNPIKSMENFRYFGGGDFSGRVLCSMLDGQFVEAFGYTNGQYNGRILLTKNLQSALDSNQNIVSNYSTLRFHEGIRTRSGTYSLEEKCIHGHTLGFCIQCKETSDTTNNNNNGDNDNDDKDDNNSGPPGIPPCKHGNIGSCWKCIDESLHLSCDICGSSLGCGCNSQGGGSGGSGGGSGGGPIIIPGGGTGGSGGSGGTNQPRCPYGVCQGNPCSCCALCRGRCKCSGCHRYPCVCCPGRQCPQCHGYPEVQPGKETSACPRCSCIVVTVSVSPTAVELGEKVRISVSVSPSSARCSYIEFNMSKNGDEKMLKSFNANPPMSIEEMMRQPGKYKVTVIAQFDGYEGIYESKPVVLTGIFPHVNKIVGLPVVKSGMNTAWEYTKTNADKEGMQEFGGVVTIHTQPQRGELYSFDPCEGDKGPYEVGLLEIVLHPTDSEINDFRNGGSYAVMLFHTHPPYWNSPDKSIARNLGPSEPDKQNFTTYPAVVYDFDNSKFTKYTPNTPREQCQIKPYIYGPERRTIK